MSDYYHNKVLLKIGASQEPIEFVTTPGRAFILIAQLQLALRHPGNVGASAAIAQQMITHLANAICSVIPEARAYIEQGMNPAYDVTREAFELEFPSPTQAEIDVAYAAEWQRLWDIQGRIQDLWLQLDPQQQEQMLRQLQLMRGDGALAIVDSDNDDDYWDNEPS